MKRILKIVGLVLVLLVLALAAVVAATFLGRQSITDGAQIGTIRIVKDGIVSVAVLPVGPREVALVDAGNDTAGAAILAELGKRQLGPEPVTAIFLPQRHPDHT